VIQEWDTVAGSREHGDQISGFIKGEQFLDELRYCKIL